MQFISSFTKGNSENLIEKLIYKHKLLLFFVIFGLQLLFYSKNISDNSLWYDECFTVNTANKSIAGAATPGNSSRTVKQIEFSAKTPVVLMLKLSKGSTAGYGYRVKIDGDWL